MVGRRGSIHHSDYTPMQCFSAKQMTFVDVLGGGIGDMEAFNASISRGRAMGSEIRGLLLVLSEVTTRYFTGEVLRSQLTNSSCKLQ